MLKQFESKIKQLIEYNWLLPEEQRFFKEFCLWTEQNLKEKTEYLKFIDVFNKLRDTKFIPDVKTREKYYEFSYNYSFEDRVKALKNALKVPFFKDLKNIGIINLDWILNPENLGKYINYKAPATPANTEVNNTNFESQNYNEM